MKFRTLVIALAATIFSVAALAGTVQGAIPVVITVNGDGSTEVSGNLVHVRFSDNDVEYIGCGTSAGIQVLENGEYTEEESGFCQAQDADEVRISCYAHSPTSLQAIRSLSDYSYLQFKVDEDGNCFDIGVSTQSFYIPDYAEN